MVITSIQDKTNTELWASQTVAVGLGRSRTQSTWLLCEAVGCGTVAGELGQYTIWDFVVAPVHRAPVLPAELAARVRFSCFPSEFLRSEGNISSVSTYTLYLHTSHVSSVHWHILFPTTLCSWNCITEFSVPQGILWFGSIMYEIRRN